MLVPIATPTPVFSGCEKMVAAASRLDFLLGVVPAAAEVVDAIDGDGETGAGRLTGILLAALASPVVNNLLWLSKYDIVMDDGRWKRCRKWQWEEELGQRCERG